VSKPMKVRRLEKQGRIFAPPESEAVWSGYVVLEPGGEVGEHRTGESEEVIVVLEGMAEVTCAGKKETVGSPAAVLIPPNSLHNVRNASRTQLRYVYVVSAGRQ